MLTKLREVRADFWGLWPEQDVGGRLGISQAKKGSNESSTQKDE